MHNDIVDPRFKGFGTFSVHFHESSLSKVFVFKNYWQMKQWPSSFFALSLARFSFCTGQKTENMGKKDEKQKTGLQSPV